MRGQSGGECGSRCGSVAIVSRFQPIFELLACLSVERLEIGFITVQLFDPSGAPRDSGLRLH